jgi:hypothetical protein
MMNYHDRMDNFTFWYEVLDLFGPKAVYRLKPETAAYVCQKLEECHGKQMDADIEETD